MKNIILTFLLVLPTFLSSQSGFTRNEKGYFIKLDVSQLNADKYYDRIGNSQTTDKFKQSSINLYADYGFNDRLSFIVYAPVYKVNGFENANNVSGIGDLRLEAKYRLTDNNLPIAFSIAPELPVGRTEAFVDDKSNPGQQINLSTGDGEFNVWMTLAASKPLRNAYVSAFVAYDFRSKYEGHSFRNLYQLGVEFGIKPFRPLWVNAKLKAQFSDGLAQNLALPFIKGDATTYTQISVEALYKVNKNFGVVAAYLSGGEFISSFRNIYIASFASLGIVYEH